MAAAFCLGRLPAAAAAAAAAVAAAAAILFTAQQNIGCKYVKQMKSLGKGVSLIDSHAI
jgi:hypothetical protein